MCISIHIHLVLYNLVCICKGISRLGRRKKIQSLNDLKGKRRYWTVKKETT